MSLEKLKIFRHLQKLPKNVGYLGKLLLPKALKVTQSQINLDQSGHANWDQNLNSISWMLKERKM